MNRRSSSICFAAASVLLLSAASVHAIERVGVLDAKFGWSPGHGVNGGYVVFVSRNGGDYVAEELVGSPLAVVEADDYGDELSILVRGYGQVGGSTIPSPDSPASEPVSFAPPPQLSGHGSFVLRCSDCDDLKLRAVDDGAVGPPRSAPPAGWELALTADVDADGADDLLWRDSETGALLLEMPRGNDLAFAASGDPALSGLTVVGAGDLDQDGSSDIVLAAPGSGEVQLWSVSGAQLVLSSRVGGPDASTAIGVADFGGDSRPDVLWRGTRVSVTAADASSDSGGGFFLFALLQRILALFTGSPSPPSGEVTTVTQGLIVTETGGIALDLGPEVPAQRSVVGIADYDGDGASDVLWRDPDATLVLWRVAGSALLSRTPFPREPGDDLLDVVASHDFFGGTGHEVALQSRTTGRVTLVDPAGARVVYADLGLAWRAAGVVE